MAQMLSLSTYTLRMVRANNTHARTRTFLFVYCWIPYTAFFRSSNSLVDGYFFFFSFCFFCVYHSFVFISHPSAISFLFLVSGETTVVALTLTLCFRHSDFGVCVCFGYCACFTFVLPNCMMIFTAFYEHLPISFISLRKSQDNLRLFGSSWSTRWRYVRAGSRIRCTCWTHEHINAYKYERWEREQVLHTY